MNAAERTWLRVIVAMMIVLLVILPAALALFIGSWSDFGQDVDPAFFDAMATGVIPVLLIAAIVQYSALFSRRIDKPQNRSSETTRYLHSRYTELYGLIFAAGEGIALYGVATNEQTTFLVASSSLYALALLLLLILEVKGLSESTFADIPPLPHGGSPEGEGEPGDDQDVPCASQVP